MKVKTEYIVTDEDGDKERIVIINNICCCCAGKTSCYDSDVLIYEELDDETPMRFTVSSNLSQFIEMLLIGYYTKIEEID